MFWQLIILRHLYFNIILSVLVIFCFIFLKGKLPFGDVTNEEVKQKVLNGQRPIKPRNCSGEM